MKKINFENLPSTNTPLSAENLNLMQSNMEEVGVAVSSTEPITEEKVWFKNSKNLFNKDNAKILNAYIDGGTTAITSHANNRILYIPCEPNTTYTVQKYKSEMFTVGYTNELPNIGVQSYSGTFGTRGSYDGTIVSLSITTGDSAKYLVLRYYQTAQDTNVSEQEILNSIQIELGNTASEYEPYIDKGICVKKEDGTYEEYIKPQVKVSSTEPTNEDVWFKKGKNLFNIKNITLPVTLLDDTSFKSNGVSGTLFDYDFKENTQYTISLYMQHSQSGWGQYIKINYTDGTYDAIAIESAEKKYLKLTTPSNKTISNITLAYSTYSIVTTISELQIEAGTEATAYQPYIDKEIYVKNANGVFEKFANVEESEIDIAKLLTNGWEVQFSTECFKRGDVVHLRLSVKKGNATTMFTLPEGYRPSATIQTAICGIGQTSTIYIRPTGVVELVDNSLVNYGNSAIYANITYKV